MWQRQDLGVGLSGQNQDLDPDVSKQRQHLGPDLFDTRAQHWLFRSYLLASAFSQWVPEPWCPALDASDGEWASNPEL